MSEIEFGTKIIASPKLTAYLKKHFKSGPTSSVSKKIYKKPGENFFFRITTETIANETKYFFSLKEDLLARDQAEGLKISEEIDIPVDKDQQDKLAKILTLLDYKTSDEITKTREVFLGQDVEITIDHYPTNDYLEVEGPSKDIVNSIVKALPFTPLPK